MCCMCIHMHRYAICILYCLYIYFMYIIHKRHRSTLKPILPQVDNLAILELRYFLKSTRKNWQLHIDQYILM